MRADPVISFIPARNATRLDRAVGIHKLVDYIIKNSDMFSVAAEFLVECYCPEDVWNKYQQLVAIGEPIDAKLPGLVCDALSTKEDGQEVNIGEIRGKILEVYLARLLRRFYGDDAVVHCRRFVAIDEWTSPKEVDVLSWHVNRIGEFYECKIDPTIRTTARLLEEYINNQNEISRKIPGKTLIGLACLISTETCIHYLKQAMGATGVRLDSYLIAGSDRLHPVRFLDRWEFQRGVAL